MKRMFFLIIGLVVIISASLWGIFVYQFISQAAAVQGEVIKLNSGGSHPQIRFTTQEGKEIEYPQNGLIFGYEVGDKVGVLYDQRNPKNASVNTFGALWGFPILILTLGLIFVIVGIFQ